MRKHVLIIAEAGVNHNGSIELAKKLIDVAADAGADYVKFQTFRSELLVSRSAEKAKYQVQNMSAESDSSQLGMLKKLELSYEDHLELMQHCSSRNIQFLSSPFDTESIGMLKEFGIILWKIPSGEITNLPYLEAIGALKQEVILSTGMSDLNEIKKAVAVLEDAGTPKARIKVLHCNSEYPTPFEDVNLRAMNEISRELDVVVGYSDHTEGIEVAVAAVALGAEVVEKHFTLDKSMDGPDHKASLDPGELRKLISSIRNIESALGDGEKRPSQSETPNIPIVRKSIHLKNNMSEGQVIEEKDLVMLRPGDGISPMDIAKILQRRTAKNLAEGNKLNWSDII